MKLDGQSEGVGRCMEGLGRTGGGVGGGDQMRDVGEKGGEREKGKGEKEEEGVMFMLLSALKRWCLGSWPLFDWGLLASCDVV